MKYERGQLLWWVVFAIFFFSRVRTPQVANFSVFRTLRALLAKLKKMYMIYSFLK